jgi:hypothetical protein
VAYLLGKPMAASSIRGSSIRFGRFTVSLVDGQAGPPRTSFPTSVHEPAGPPGSISRYIGYRPCGPLLITYRVVSHTLLVQPDTTVETITQYVDGGLILGNHRTCCARRRHLRVRQGG